MKYTFYSLLFFTVGNIFSSMASRQGPLPPIDLNNNSLKAQKCWFVDKQLPYPFKNKKLIELYPTQSMPNSHFLYALSFSTLPPAITSLANIFFSLPVPLALIPFCATNLISIPILSLFLHKQFEAINQAGFRLEKSEIELYLDTIKTSIITDLGLCACRDTIVSWSEEKITNTTKGTEFENDLKLSCITIPKRFKQKLVNKTSLSTVNFFCTAALTIALTYFSSKLLHRAEIVNLNKNFFTMAICTTIFNWSFLYVQNAEHRKTLESQVLRNYTDWVIAIHNTQIIDSE